jgi:hypothetical protein
VLNNNFAEPARARVISRLTRVACWIVGKDPVLLARTREVFHFQAVCDAILLIVISGIALFTWSAFFAQFFPAVIAMPLTVFAIVWLVLVDRTMATANWNPKGVLREKRKGFQFSLFAFRLAIAVVTSLATSYSAMMVLNSESIDAQIAENVASRNGEKVAETAPLFLRPALPRMAGHRVADRSANQRVTSAGGSFLCILMCGTKHTYIQSKNKAKIAPVENSKKAGSAGLSWDLRQKLD